MRVVVTGAAGFIGAHLVSGLVAAGHRVVAVDLPDVLAAGSRPMPAGATLLGLDLAVDDLAPVLADSPEAVLHLAGRPGVRTSFGAGRAATIRDHPRPSATIRDHPRPSATT